MSSNISSRRVVTVSLVVDVVDVLTNLAVVLLTGSAVIFAELSMGLADVGGSLLLVIGERRARLPHDDRHPHGYGREVFFWSLLSAIVMLVVGGGLSLVRGTQQIVDPEPVSLPWLALAVITVSIATNTYAVSLAVRSLATRGGNLLEAFRAQSAPLVKTSLLRDLIGVLSSIVGLVALLIYLVAGSVILDGIGAIGVGALTVLFAVLVIAQARGLITGRAVPDVLNDCIRDAVEHTPRVVALNRMAAVYSGGEEVLVDLDLDLADGLETSEIEAVIDEVQSRVRTACPTVQRVRVDLNSPATLAQWLERAADDQSDGESASPSSQ